MYELQITPQQICNVVANITGDESFMKKTGIKVHSLTNTIICRVTLLTFIYTLIDGNTIDDTANSCG